MSFVRLQMKLLPLPINADDSWSSCPILTIDRRAEHDSFARVLQTSMSISIARTVVGT